MQQQPDPYHMDLDDLHLEIQQSKTVARLEQIMRAAKMQRTEGRITSDELRGLRMSFAGVKAILK